MVKAGLDMLAMEGVTFSRIGGAHFVKKSSCCVQINRVWAVPYFYRILLSNYRSGSLLFNDEGGITH